MVIDPLVRLNFLFDSVMYTLGRQQVVYVSFIRM